MDEPRIFALCDGEVVGNIIVCSPSLIELVANGAKYREVTGFCEPGMSWDD
jgi:hypothetical protein